MGTNYVKLSDGRWLCLQCMESAVMDTWILRRLKHENRERISFSFDKHWIKLRWKRRLWVHFLFETSNLFLAFSLTLSHMLVSTQTGLSIWGDNQRYLSLWSADHHHKCKNTLLRALESKTIWEFMTLIILVQVSKRPRMGPHNQLIDMVTDSQRVVRDCEVTAILILYGLPRYCNVSSPSHLSRPLTPID